MDDDDSEIERTIVIDNGSGYIKYGLDGENEPKVFPNITGLPKYASSLVTSKEEIFIGNDAYEKKSVLNLSHTIKRAFVKDWNLMEKIWDYIFQQKLDKEPIYPNDNNILITQPLKNLKENKKKIAEIMFETFNFKGLYLAYPTVLSLYAAGKFTGMSLDLGYGTSQFSPIFDGYIIQDNVERVNIGGKDITKYLGKLLNKNLKEKIPKYMVNNIKEKSCYIALDYEYELKSVEPFDYELPDGTHIIIDEKRIKCPESFIFNPKLKWLEEKGIQEICNDLIQKCDSSLRKDLYNCIVLSGGNSMFKELPERLTKEIEKLAQASMEEEVKVIASPERKNWACMGGLIVSNLVTFKNAVVTRDNYEENGFSIIEKKFI
jgi:actin